jgi:hypothetical protein
MRDRRDAAARQSAAVHPSASDAPAAAATSANRAGSARQDIRLAVALIVVGILLLTVRYFAPVILLAALPTRQWREAAFS